VAVNYKVAISGGCDPIHVGHVRMIQQAAEYGDVIVILNSDEWLMRKKGFVFMAWEERAEIISAIKGVTKVVYVDDSDGTVCEALLRIKPHFFANGGDRTDINTPEKQICIDNDITMIWGIGGGKIQSSSDLVAKVRNNEKPTI
jgi:D-beta-D-heptose 7-phosphate kinase/D-beta-D-heptose 1-phosphate adenosyltransferase